MTKPHFTHDCDRCEYVGSFENREGKHDCYIHKYGWRDPSVIARFGNEGWEYASMMADSHNVAMFRKQSHVNVSIAYRLACEKGMVKDGA